MNEFESQINLKVVNNTALPQPVSILGIVPNQNTANNNNVLYEFDFTTQSFVGVTTVNINIANTSNPTFVVNTAQVTSQSIIGVVNALNTLNQGLFIIHNHPDKINSKGGNTVREPLGKWIKGRDIVSVEKTNLKPDDIEKLYQELKKYKYDFINFNCEHFVNFAKDKNYVSPQVLRWTTIALIGLGVFFLLKNKRL